MGGHEGDDGYAHDAVFSLSTDADRADRLRAALAREVGEIDDDRSRARLTDCDETVGVAVEARDVSALRAATGTWLGLLQAADETAAAAEAVREDTSPDGADGPRSGQP